MKFRILTILTFSLFVIKTHDSFALKSERIMFYNVENLFHPSNDSLKNDDEFTKEGLRHWSFYHYFTKINNIAKTIIAVGEWNPPFIVGLCEIENEQCLIDLTKSSPLTNLDYDFIHFESADKRGIDVALLYRKAIFQPVYSFPFKASKQNERATRDILYVKGLLGTDTLHFFVNHWPSRYGGHLETIPKRVHAAKILKSKIDSILSVIPNSKIIAMGDFNDYPNDSSMAKVLKAKKDTINLKTNELINTIWQYENEFGTHKYQQQWHILDQFIISQSLLNSNAKIYTKLNFSSIFKADWLFIKEKNGIGIKPFRTYNGFKFINGFSDHLPIYLDIKIN